MGAMSMRHVRGIGGVRPAAVATAMRGHAPTFEEQLDDRGGEPGLDALMHELVGPRNGGPSIGREQAARTKRGASAASKARSRQRRAGRRTRSRGVNLGGGRRGYRVLAKALEKRGS